MASNDRHNSIGESIANIRLNIRYIFSILWKSSYFVKLRGFSLLTLNICAALIISGVISLSSSFAELNNCAPLSDGVYGPLPFQKCHPVADFWQLFKNYWFPWRLVFLAATLNIITFIALRYDGKALVDARSRLDELEGKLENSTDKFRAEYEAHGETKSAYYEDLKKFFIHLLPLSEVRFDNTCRVSLYRKHPEEQGVLIQVFRHSDRPSFAESGRVKIPHDEGIVGITWNDLEYVNASFRKTAGSHGIKAEFCRLFSERAPGNRVKPPGQRAAKMPSRSYLAVRMCEPHRNDAFGVLVIESTEERKFDELDFPSIISARGSALMGASYALCALDSIFSPMGGGSNEH